MRNEKGQFVKGFAHNKGRKQTEAHIEKLRIKRIGKKTSEDTKEKMRISRSKWTMSKEAGIKISLAKKGKSRPDMQGENHRSWIKNRTLALEKHRLRSTLEWKFWRESVFKRDEYTCKECGNTGCYLEPHHILPIRTNEEKMFDINNGITLCKPCHKKTFWKEEEFIEKYSLLIKREKHNVCII